MPEEDALVGTMTERELAIDTAEARELLTALSKGDQEMRATKDAALKRMEQK